MSVNALRVRCHCGKTLKDSHAMMQHTRDSPSHQQGNVAPPSAPGERSACSCGRIFKTAEALQQHKRDSLSHTKPETGLGVASGANEQNDEQQPGTRKDRGVVEETWNQRDGNPLLSEETWALWRQQSDFVGAGNKAGKKGKKKMTGLASGSTRVTSASGISYPDVGDNHSLCDKDCGWCGHCADGVYF